MSLPTRRLPLISKFFLFLSVILDDNAVVSSESRILNVPEASDAYELSNEYGYEYMVDVPPTSETRSIEFHWTNPVENSDNEEESIFEGRIVCVAENPPSWLGFAMLEEVDGGPKLIDGSDAVIANASSYTVTPYTIIRNDNDAPFPVEKGTIDPDFADKNKLHLHFNEGGGILTVLTFQVKIGVDDGFTIDKDGGNIFALLIGPLLSDEDLAASGDIDLSNEYETAFSLDFERVSDDYLYSTPENCKSDDDDYRGMVILDDKFKFYWTLLGVYGDPITPDNKDDQQPNQVKIMVKHKSKSWIGVGIAGEGGGMIGSHVTIGLPDYTDAGGEVPLKYELRAKNITGIVPLGDGSQTLMDASVGADGLETVMKFTKLLKEYNEPTMLAHEEMSFVYAIGVDTLLAKHKKAGMFRVKLNGCVHDRVDHDSLTGGRPIDDNSNSEEDMANQKAIWIVHGLLGFLAFAIATPTAIASSFLRNIIPAAWIRVHVFGNILSFIFAVVTFCLAVSTKMVNGEVHFADPHHIMGLILFLLICFQMLNVVLRPKIDDTVYTPRLPHMDEFEDIAYKTPRQKWLYLHRCTGITVLALGLFQVGSGLTLFSDFYGTAKLQIPYIVYVVLAAVGVATLKIRNPPDDEDEGRVVHRVERRLSMI